VGLVNNQLATSVEARRRPGESECDQQTEQRENRPSTTPTPTAAPPDRPRAFDVRHAGRVRGKGPCRRTDISRKGDSVCIGMTTG
jgi:hypothetical protein